MKEGQNYDPNTLASQLVDFTADIDSGQEFSFDTMHLFCSPLFLRSMRLLYDMGIKTISCGSGKERGILPGITCDFDSLCEENKVIAKEWVISEKEFRIGVPIKENTTFAEFDEKLVELVQKLKSQN